MTTKEKVSIEKINIKIGKEEISLSPEAAAELKDLLNELFGAPEAEKVYIPGQPYPVYPRYPRYPEYPRWDPYKRWDYWTTTWGNTTTALGHEFNGTVTYCLDAN